MNKKVNIIKDINLNKVRSALKEIGTATKPQLSEITGLSVVTINSLVNTLLDTGEIFPDDKLHSDNGRPAASFRYNSEFHLVLVIFMHEFKGQDIAYYSVVNLRGEVIEKKEQILTNVHMESFDSYIEKLLNEFPQIKGICFGIPGYEVNHNLVISDYENMRNQSLSGHVREKFHLPVLVENDINAAVSGYCHSHNIQKDNCVIGLYFPDKYPPGSGIYLNGIIQGRNGLAGEIKYLPFGIDWETFDYNQEQMNEIIVKTIQASMCMLNPHKIILYGKKINHSFPKMIYEKCLSSIEKILFPEIIISENLHVDFEVGIKQIALKMIDPEEKLINKIIGN